MKNRGKLENRIAPTKFEVFTGFGQATRVRLLGNCFKHNGGETNDKWVEEYGGDVGKEIDYEGEDWKHILDEVEAFLMGVAKALSDAEARRLEEEAKKAKTEKG